VTGPVRVAVTVNGIRHVSDVPARQLLVSYLREDIGLTGTKIGCDTSSCGACTVLLDDESVKSCTIFTAQADGEDITTIEGLASDGELHPVQRAFNEQHALQCGYCTPGMVLALVSLLREQPDADEQEIRRGLEGNLCRCTGYTPIVRAACSITATGGRAGPPETTAVDGQVSSPDGPA
jgi:aerobic carbon-monoxide dehydrogenase small subunit